MRLHALSRPMTRSSSGWWAPAPLAIAVECSPFEDGSWVATHEVVMEHAEPKVVLSLKGCSGNPSNATIRQRLPTYRYN